MQDHIYQERRKYKRLPIELHLEIDELFKQDNILIQNLHMNIDVFDISKSGIGFISKASLPLGYYFRGRISLSESDFFYVVICIVRVHQLEDKNIYGAEFIGLAPFLAEKVDQYEKRLNKQ